MNGHENGIKNIFTCFIISGPLAYVSHVNQQFFVGKTITSADTYVL